MNKEYQNSFLTKLPLDLLIKQIDYIDTIKDFQKFCFDSTIFKKLCQDENGVIWKFLYHRDFSLEIKLDKDYSIMTQYLLDKQFFRQIFREYINTHENDTLFLLRQKMFLTAVEKGYEILVSYILKHFTIDVQLIYRGMDIACKNNHYSILKILFEKDTYNPSLSETDLILLAANSGSLLIVKYLVNKGLIPNSEALRYSILHNHFDVVKYLIEECNIQVSDDMLNMPVSRGHLSMVEYLVKHGANPRYNSDGMFHSAASNGQIDMLKYLMVLGADIHSNNEKALLLSSREGRFEVVQFLIENGSDLHTDNEHALRIAIIKGHMDIVSYLINKGANIDNVLNNLDTIPNDPRFPGFNDVNYGQYSRIKQLKLLQLQIWLKSGP